VSKKKAQHLLLSRSNLEQNIGRNISKTEKIEGLLKICVQLETKPNKKHLFFVVL